MQCRLLIYFTILGFHLVVSYPKIQRNYHHEEPEPILKLEQLQNENYPNQGKEIKSIYGGKLDQAGEEIHKAQYGNLNHETSENYHDNPYHGAVYDRVLNRLRDSHQDKELDYVRRNQLRHQIYTLLRTHHSPPLEANRRYERHTENDAASTHINPEPQVDKHQKNGDRDEYKPEHFHTVDGYDGNPNEPRVSGDPYYKAYEHEYYSHPNYGLDLDFNQGYAHIYQSEEESDDPRLINLDNNEDDFELPKISNTEPGNKKYNDQYIEKYFKPEYIIPIQSTTNSSPLQKIKLNEDSKSNLKPLPESLKWVEHIEENDPYDRMSDIHEKTILKDENTFHTDQVKNATTSKPTTIKDTNILEDVSQNNETDTCDEPNHKFESINNNSTEDKNTFTTIKPNITEDKLDNVALDNITDIPDKDIVFKDENLSYVTEGNFSFVTTTEPTTVKGRDNLGIVPHDNVTELTEKTKEEDINNTSILNNVTTTKPTAVKDQDKLLENVSIDHEINIQEKSIVIKDENLNTTEMKNDNITKPIITNEDEENKNKPESVVPGESTTDPVGKHNNLGISTSHNSATLDSTILGFRGQNESNIDLPHMKPISEPLIWFRPDEEFWKKVQNGETTYDKVVFVQVRPTAVIERHVKEFHHANGTVIKDHYEALWDHEDDPSPKKISTNRVIEHPDGSSSSV